MIGLKGFVAGSGQKRGRRGIVLAGIVGLCATALAAGPALAGKKPASTKTYTPVTVSKPATGTRPQFGTQPQNQVFKFPWQQPQKSPYQNGSQNSQGFGSQNRTANPFGNPFSSNRNSHSNNSHLNQNANPAYGQGKHGFGSTGFTQDVTRSPFHSKNKGFFGSIFQKPPGSKGYRSFSTFYARGTPATFRRDRATGSFQLLVGANLLDLGAPNSASVVAVQDFAHGQVTVMQDSTDDCPTDYVAVDATTAPYHNWHMGDCHTNLAFWTNGNQLFAQSTAPGDGRVWVYSEGQMYGPLQQNAVFHGAPPAPPPPEQAGPPPDQSNGDEDQGPDSQTPAQPAPDQAAPAGDTGHARKSHKTQADTSTAAAAAPPAPQRLPRTARFDPSCLKGAQLIDPADTPCSTYDPGKDAGSPG
ncbi:MAG TPA: hypothetical protein VMH86_16255 [Rhizomicrobium sp.]|nr:hypothetical protein [Rhizomicrobium sp.]